VFITAVPITKLFAGGERPESTGSKIMFSLSRITRSEWIPYVFLIFTTRVGLKTRLNGVKSIFFEKS
jgi:hypothetical protein